MDDDLLSSYNLDDHWYCARGDRYLGLRFGSPIRSGWWIRLYFRKYFQTHLRSQIRWHLQIRYRSSLVGLCCRNRCQNVIRSPIPIGYAIHSRYHSKIRGRWC